MRTQITWMCWMIFSAHAWRLNTSHNERRKKMTLDEYAQALTTLPDEFKNLNHKDVISSEFDGQLTLLHPYKLPLLWKKGEWVKLQFPTESKINV